MGIRWIGAKAQAMDRHQANPRLLKDLRICAGGSASAPYLSRMSRRASVKNPWWKMPTWDLDWPPARAWTYRRPPEVQPVLDERDLQPPAYSARFPLRSPGSPQCGNRGRSHSSDLAPRDFLHQRSAGSWWPTLLQTQGGRKRAGHRSQTCPLGRHHLGIPDGKALRSKQSMS